MGATTSPTQVLIVGAGPTGLALAIELGHRGVSCLVIEKNDRVGYAPRAKTTNVRTREHMRRWGIADNLRAASPLGKDYPSNVVFCTQLAGLEITRIENAMYCAAGRNPLYSEHAQWIPQYKVEEVLRSYADSLPSVNIRFNCELIDFEQDTETVHANIRDLENNKNFKTNSKYLVGADGARSIVRDLIGTKMEGKYGLSHNYNIVFRAPGLSEAHDLGPAIMYWQINSTLPGVIGPMDEGDIWYFMPTHVGTETKISISDASKMIARSTGVDLEYEILSSDQWVASRLLGDKYRNNRVFLAGDACHLHPPFGGYGMNMGIADGVDLGWKLAAMLQGWAGPTLLDSYEAERRPVHQWVLDEAELNHSVLSNHLVVPGLEQNNEDGKRIRSEIAQRIQASKCREFSTLGVVLGYRYENSPVIIPDGTEIPSQDFINYFPTSRPGSLAPHVWLHDGSSIYDHFGTGYTLLAWPSVDSSEIAAFASMVASERVPLKTIQPTEGGVRNLYCTPFTLIRPDQHVAWRGESLPSQKIFLTIIGKAEI